MKLQQEVPLLLPLSWGGPEAWWEGASYEVFFPALSLPSEGTSLLSAPVHDGITTPPDTAEKLPSSLMCSVTKGSHKNSGSCPCCGIVLVKTSGVDPPHRKRRMCTIFDFNGFRIHTFTKKKTRMSILVIKQNTIVVNILTSKLLMFQLNNM